MHDLAPPSPRAVVLPRIGLAGLAVVAGLAACAPEGPTPEPVQAPPSRPADVPPPPPPPQPATSASASATSVPASDAGGGDLASGNVGPILSDPAKGKFTLTEATVGLLGDGPLLATIKTSQGDLTCRLFDDKAPRTVANFVGLARGTRPWKDPTGAWVTRPAYDGTTFHRVIRGFMIQGGDPKGTGAGEPGYTIPDEIWPGTKHDRAGLLCMANRGPNTNGAQFFITDASAPHLTRAGTYTVFGECAPVSVVHAIANVPTAGGDRPVQDVVISSITIERKPETPPKP